MSGVVVVYERDGLCVATFDAICITAIRGPVTREFLHHADATGDALAKRLGRKIGALDVIGADAPLPSAELRAEAAAIAKSSDERVAAGAYLVAGEGFAASAKRSVLTAMSLVGPGAPRRAFSEAHAAVEWLAKQLGASSAALAPATTWCGTMMRPAR